MTFRPLRLTASTPFSLSSNALRESQISSILDTPPSNISHRQIEMDRASITDASLWCNWMPSLSKPRDMSSSSPGLSRVLIATTTSGRCSSFVSTTTMILAGASGSIKGDMLGAPWICPFRLLMTKSSSRLVDGAGAMPRIISVIRLIDRKRDSTSALTQDCFVIPMSSPDMSMMATGGKKSSAQPSVRRCPSITPSSDPASTSSCAISSAPSDAACILVASASVPPPPRTSWSS